MEPVTQEQVKKFEHFIDQHDCFFVTGHKEPDGDCLTSALGVIALLRKKKKKFQLLSVGPFKRPEIKRFEKLFSKRCSMKYTEKERVGLIIVDCSEMERIGDEILPIVKDFDRFIIDHHRTSSGSLENSIIDSNSPATAYLIQQLYERIIGELDFALSETLFFGICTDTGFFRFLDEGSQDIFEAVSRLVKHGANPRKTYAEITSGKPFSTRKLIGIMLDRAIQYFDGKLIVTFETLEDTRLFGKEGRDSDSLYQLLLSVDGVEAVLFVRQDTDKTCTAGFRSKDHIDVSSIAAAFGGGGHKNAAGLSTTGKIDNLIPKIIKEFGKIF